MSQSTIIKAICHFDLNALDAQLCDISLHCDIEKSMFLERVAIFFDRMKDDTTTLAAEAIEWNCDEGCSKVHNSSILFTIDEKSFVWDIRQLRSGLFVIEECESATNEPRSYSRDCLGIFEDECASFVPCDEFLRLSEAVDKMMVPLLSDTPTFWFSEDLDQWLYEYRKEITLVCTKFWRTKKFWELGSTFYLLRNLSLGLNNEDFLLYAVQKYKEIPIGDTWAYYDWYEQYKGDIFQNSIGSFNLIEKDKGYFTLADSLPNLRIGYRGHEAYFEYIQANTAAFVSCTDLIFDEFWMEHEYEFLDYDPDEDYRRSQRGPDDFPLFF